MAGIRRMAGCRGAVVPWWHTSVVPWCRGAMVPWCQTTVGICGAVGPYRLALASEALSKSTSFDISAIEASAAASCLL